MRIDSLILPKRNMHESTLICIHGRKVDGLMLGDRTRSCRFSHSGNLVMPTTLISLDIDGNRIPEAKFTTHQE